MNLPQWVAPTAQCAIQITQFVSSNMVAGASRDIGVKLVDYLKDKLSERFDSEVAIQEKLSHDSEFEKRLKQLITEFQASPGCPQEFKENFYKSQQNNLKNVNFSSNSGLINFGNTGDIFNKPR